MRAISLFTKLALAAATVATPFEQWIPGQEVQTSSGKVKGQPATRPGFSGVSQYVGIPYAEPPVGALRWAPPKPFKSSGSIDGTKWVCVISSSVLRVHANSLSAESVRSHTTINQANRLTEQATVRSLWALVGP
jgi:hypothetical protein